MNKLFLTLLITTSTNLVTGYKNTFGNPDNVVISEDGAIASEYGFVRGKIQEKFFRAFEAARFNLQTMNDCFNNNQHLLKKSTQLKQNPQSFFSAVIILAATLCRQNNVASQETIFSLINKINEAYHDLAFASHNREDDLYNFELINNFFEKDVFQRLSLPENIQSLLQTSYKRITYAKDLTAVHKTMMIACKIKKNISRFDIETICEYTKILQDL